ncbi:MAG: amidohydrolase family protein [Verrucomicrobia bacterium]|nr:amidohydrolase family protein [Verrucomicrobiota bacterium]
MTATLPSLLNPLRLPRRRGWRRALLGLALVPLLGIAGCALLYQGPYLPVQPLPPEPLLDMHCHVAGIGAGGSGCFVSEGMRDSFKFGIYLKSFGVTRRELERDGDGLVVRRVAEQIAASRHVGRAIVLALDGVVDDAGDLDRKRTEIYVPDEFVAPEIARHTNLWFGASVNPYRRDALERLEWAHAHGAKLVKWIPSIMHIDPADERLIPFYRKLVELRLPLLTHAGQERSFTRADDELADPQRLHLPLRLGVTVIAAHVASTGAHDGERDTDRLARLMTQYTNVWTDISSLTQINKLGYLGEALRRPEFRGRLLYGTDFPLINTVTVSPWYFPLNLRFRQMWRLSRIGNPWDRDVALKQALGTPPEVFQQANRLWP